MQKLRIEKFAMHMFSYREEIHDTNPHCPLNQILNRNFKFQKYFCSSLEIALPHNRIDLVSNTLNYTVLSMRD